MANRSTPIYKNPVYSKMLFKISKDLVTSTQLAMLLKKEQSPVLRQLKILEKNRYLILDKEKKQCNKKLYSVNWNMIAHQLYLFLNSIDPKKVTQEDIKKLFSNPDFMFFLTDTFVLVSGEEDMTLERYFFALVRVLGGDNIRKSTKSIIDNDLFRMFATYRMKLYLNEPDCLLLGALENYEKKSNQTHL